MRGLGDADVVTRFSAWLTLAALLLLGVFVRRMGLAYSVLSVFFILVPFAAAASMPRYLLASFRFRCSSRGWAGAGASTKSSVGLALLQGFLMVFWANKFKLVV